jgi:TolA-binding protein
MWNSTWKRVHGASLATVVLLAAGTLVAQESKTSKSEAPAKRSADPARRVPAYFGQIGLTPEQRETIYKIRGKHQARVDELEKQIDETQALMLGECEGVLTDTQKQMVEQRRKAASAGRKVQDMEKPGKIKTGSGG